MDRERKERKREREILMKVRERHIFYVLIVNSDVIN